jgi:hypothetical protein
MVGDDVKLVEEDEFNFVVGIKRFHFGNPEPEIDHEGSGSLISPIDVLTIASVVHNIESEKFEVVGGSIDLRLITSYNPSWWIHFDNWASVNNEELLYNVNDICIIRVSYTFKLLYA